MNKASVIKQYRKKPVIIEAILYQGEEDDEIIKNFVNDGNLGIDVETGKWSIGTLEGIHTVSKGDYIIKGVAGEFYPCKPSIFQETYEEVNTLR